MIPHDNEAREAASIVEGLVRTHAGPGAATDLANRAGLLSQLHANFRATISERIGLADVALLRTLSATASGLAEICQTTTFPWAVTLEISERMKARDFEHAARVLSDLLEYGQRRAP